MTDHRETVPEGHNIVDYGFALGYDNSTSSVKAFFRSEHTKGSNQEYNTYLASAELINGVWRKPIAITKPGVRAQRTECNACVITDNDVVTIPRVGLKLPIFKFSRAYKYQGVHIQRSRFQDEHAFQR